MRFLVSIFLCVLLSAEALQAAGYTFGPGGDLKADGSVPMAGSLNFNGYAPANVPDPVQIYDVATRNYVDGISYADPGDTGSIEPTYYNSYVEIVATSDQTRSLPNPNEINQRLTISLRSTPANLVTVTITAASPVDANGRTVMYLHYNYTAGATGGEVKILQAVMVGTNLRWRIISEKKSSAIPDLGDTLAIPHDGRSGDSALSMGAGAETRTLANPTHQGQIITLTLSATGGGTIAVTSANVINLAGNTTITFAAVGECVVLIGVRIAGNLRWRVLANDGAVLT